MKILTITSGLPTTPAIPVKLPLSEEMKFLIDEMILTSKEVGGYGLAAPQIGINKQLFVCRTSSDGENYTVIINPTITASSGKIISKSEGCLSVPGVRKNIKRSKVFNLSYIDENGKFSKIRPITKKLAIILQHEFDHLFGKTILDK